MSAFHPRSPKIPAAASGRAALPDPKWARNAARRFHRLVKLDTAAAGLAGRGGFVAWHAGVRPRWVYVGGGRDLARAMRDLFRNADVMAFEARGGVFVHLVLRQRRVPGRRGPVSHRTPRAPGREPARAAQGYRAGAGAAPGVLGRRAAP